MSVFFAEFAAYVEIVLLSKEELLIPGNYNIHIDVAGDSDANTLSDFFESVGLQQHVEKHTHVQGHTLDLVISRRSDNIIDDRRLTTCWPFPVWPWYGFVQSQVNKTILIREDYLLQKA